MIKKLSKKCTNKISPTHIFTHLCIFSILELLLLLTIYYVVSCDEVCLMNTTNTETEWIKLCLMKQ